MWCLTITTILNNLNWTSLERRRQIARLRMFYRVLQESVALLLPDYITQKSTVTRGHDMRYSLPLSRIDAYKFSFFPNAVRLWNTLPIEVVHSTTLRTFTYLINGFLINN